MISCTPFLLKNIIKQSGTKMPFKHLNAKRNWSKFIKHRMQIVKLYNLASSMHTEEPQLDYGRLQRPDFIHAFVYEGAKGGVLIEQLLNNEQIALITFAAIESKHQGKGICSKLIEFATNELGKRGVRVVGVQMNTFDERKYWKKRGFTEEIPHQNITVLLKPSA
ncbi:GNAT family N-acetyltransferase [Vibrio cholerae]|nr:GNAT family N-acetyltransferase [Vibrio cholerae]